MDLGRSISIYYYHIMSGKQRQAVTLITVCYNTSQNCHFATCYKYVYVLKKNILPSGTPVNMILLLSIFITIKIISVHKAPCDYFQRSFVIINHNSAIENFYLICTWNRTVRDQRTVNFFTVYNQTYFFRGTWPA